MLVKYYGVNGLVLAMDISSTFIARFRVWGGIQNSQLSSNFIQSYENITKVASF